MYTVSKGPSKLVAKTRRGISQNYEKFDAIREINKKTSDDLDGTEFISIPKPVFQTTRKLSHHIKTGGHHTDEALSPQHEELIKYIHESWNMMAVANPYDVPSSPDSTNSLSSLSSSSSLSLSTNTTATVATVNHANNSSTSSLSPTSSSIYYVDPPSPVLTDFTPFDLESWWGRRLFNNITKSL